MSGRSAHGCFVAVSAIGALVTGYVLGVERAVTFLDGHARMVPITAIAFFMAGVALCYAHLRTQHAMQVTNAFAILMLGVLVLQNHAWGEWGFDDWPLSAVPGQPSVLTLLSFLLIGTALIMRAYALWAPVCAFALMALVGHALGIPALQGFLDGRTGAMSIPTCILFLVCSDALRRLDGDTRDALPATR